MITLNDLNHICPAAHTARLALFVGPLNAAMTEFDITENVARETAFIAQIAHESGCFQYVKELASGADYEGRKDLGNTEPGDGVRYKGRGLIQITGRENYAKCSTALFGYPAKLLSEPELLEQPELACRSACWWWKAHGCNELADRSDMVALTKRINGGLTGFKDRMSYFERAMGVLA